MALIVLVQLCWTPYVASNDTATAPRLPDGRHAPSVTLAITEIMYHPDDSGAEFIEILNTGVSPISIAGFRFTDGIEFEYSSGLSILPGERVVVARDEEEFGAAYPGVSAVGFFSGKLSNGGERVALADAQGRPVLALRYDDDAPWPTEADGLGNSMVISDVAGDPNDPLNWCASTTVGGSPGETEPEDCPPRYDPTDGVFAPDRVLEVEIELDQADWDSLRYQERNLFDLFAGDDCLAEPFASPFTYFPASVVIDGDGVQNVGVRKKGFLGSLSRDKPSLKIKLDEYVDGQRYSGLRRITLNNARQDPSFLNQCLGYGLFSSAGVPAPRCNFATVTVNGADLGLYVHVESVRERMLARHFERNDGVLYEGTLSDFRPGFVNTFDQKTNDGDDDRLDLEAMITALEVPDDELIGALQELMDLDAFITFWAMEVLLGHWDGYSGNTNNFFVYNDPSSEGLHFLPWGIDALFNLGENFDGGVTPPSVMAAGILSRRLYLYESTRETYVDKIVELLDTVWDETAIHQEIDRMATLASPWLSGDELAAFNIAIPSIRAFVDNRRAQLLSALLPEPPPWDEALSDPLCFSEIGEITADFETTWGTFDVVDPFQAGSGNISLVLGEQSIAPDAVGATAGTGGGDERDAVILIVGAMPDESLFAILVEMDADLVFSGSDQSFDFVSTLGLLLTLSAETGYEAQLVGLLAYGNLHFEQASTTHGGSIRGSLDATVFESFF